MKNKKIKEIVAKVLKEKRNKNKSSNKNSEYTKLAKIIADLKYCVELLDL